jgi:CheY-like chemotaxis protein
MHGAKQFMVSGTQVYHLREGDPPMTLMPTVLVIDDEDDVTTYLSTLLSNHGFNARCANSAAQGLKQLEASRPDLILLDLMMPDKTGIVLFNKIKKDARYQDIPIIIVTGIHEHFAEDYKDFFEKLKIRKPSAFFEKPVNPDELIKTVKQELGMKFDLG